MKLILSLLAAILFLYLALYTAGNLDLYYTVPYFDKIMHFTGGVLSGFIVISYVHHARKVHPPLRTALWVTLLIGIIWEIAEHSSDVFLKGTIINHYFGGGDFIDSVTDVITNLLGAAFSYTLMSKLHPFKRLDSE